MKLPSVFVQRYKEEGGYDIVVAPNLRVVAHVVDERDACYVCYQYLDDGYRVKDWLKTSDRGIAERWLAERAPTK